MTRNTIPKARIPVFRRSVTRTRVHPQRVLILAVLLLLPAAVSAQEEDHQPFLPSPVQSVSTVPANGDVNPYGVAFVPPQFPQGTAKPGDILVSNFNAVTNLQGTGTTIVDISSTGTQSLFFQSGTPTGLSTALNILRKGFVLVGNFPS